MSSTTSLGVNLDSRALLQTIRAYAEPRTARSAVELALTLLPFVALWLLTLKCLESGHWLGLLLAIPAGGCLLRIFLIQHDCGHGAFFRTRPSNDWLGRMLGVLTLTPYGYWRRSHALHHASTGNLDRRGTGDVDTITVSEYRSRSTIGQLLYRCYRNPFVLFGLGPAYLFLLRHRLPVGMMHNGWGPWISVMGTNLAILLIAAVLIWALGLTLFLLVHLPITFVAATAGVWLFYVQHQFEKTSWERSDSWTFHEAALHGSSNYILPAVLRWFTANVGAHHIHHLASRIPFYRLNDVLRDNQALASVNQLNLADSFRSVRLVLWDEEKRRLVSFKEVTASNNEN